MSDNINLDNF